MTALAKNTNRLTKGSGKVKSYPVLTNVRIYQGAAVMITSGGFAAPAAAGAGNKGCAGFATKEANNTGGASGAISVEVEEGTILLAATSITQAMVGDVMYAQDDNTIDEDAGTNLPVAGVLVEFVSTTQGWCKVGPLELTAALKNPPPA